MDTTITPHPHRGSSFDVFLKEDGIFEDVQARALKRVLAEQCDDAEQSNKLPQSAMVQPLALDK